MASFLRMRRMRSKKWQVDEPPESIYDVWDYVFTHLRKINRHIHEINHRYHDGLNPKTFAAIVYSALETIRNKDHPETNTVRGFQDLRHLRKRPQKKIHTKTLLQEIHKPKKTFRADQPLVILEEFTEKVAATLFHLEETKNIFDRHVWPHLKKYCISFPKLEGVKRNFDEELGIVVDEMEKCSEGFVRIISGVKDNRDYTEFFTNDGISGKIMPICDWPVFLIVRACPDMIQKLKNMFTLAQHWLTLDKDYTNRLEKHLERARNKCSALKYQNYISQVHHDKVYSTLKQKQNVLKNKDEKYTQAKRDIANLENKRNRIDKDLSEIVKAINRWSHHSQDRSNEWETDSDDSGASNTKSKLSMESQQIQYSNAYKYVKAYKQQLMYLKDCMRGNEAMMEEKKKLLAQLGDVESDVERLEKRYTDTQKEVSKCRDKLLKLDENVTNLESLLRARKYPSVIKIKAHEIAPRRKVQRKGQATEKPVKLPPIMEVTVGGE